MKVDFGRIKRHLRKLPAHVRDKLIWWAIQVETIGLYEMRKSSGWNDEALRGKGSDKDQSGCLRRIGPFIELINSQKES